MILKKNFNCKSKIDDKNAISHAGKPTKSVLYKNVDIPIIKWYHWFYLWMYPTYEATDETTERRVTLKMKNVNGTIYVVDEKIRKRREIQKF